MRILGKIITKLIAWIPVYFCLLVLALPAYLLFLQGTAIIPVSKSDAKYQRLIGSEKPKVNWGSGTNISPPRNNIYIRWAIAKFPDLNACKEMSQSTSLHWWRIRTDEQLLLCFHYLLEELKHRQVFVEWLNSDAIQHIVQDIEKITSAENQPLENKSRIRFGISRQPNSSIDELPLLGVRLWTYSGGGFEIVITFNEFDYYQSIETWSQSPIN